MPALGCLYARLFKARWLSFILAVLILAIAIVGVLRTRIENNGLIFIPDSRKELKAASRILATATGANLLFVDIEGDDPLNTARIIENAVPPGLARSLGKEASEMTPEKLVRAFPLLFTDEVEKMLDEQIREKGIGGLLLDNRRLVQGFGAIGLAGWVRTDPLNLRQVVGRMFPESSRGLNNPVSSDGRHSLLIFCPAGSALDTASARKLVNAIKGNAPAGTILTMSGSPVHTAANADAVENDLFRIVAFSIAGFAATYVLIARSWGALWILLTAIASTVFAMGATNLIWPATSGIAIGFGASLMGLSEDYAVHMHFALRSGTNLETIYCSLCRPLFQSFILNCSGFLVLFISSVPVIRQMAFFAVISLLTGYLLAMVVLPFTKSFSKPTNINETVTYGGAIPSTCRGIAICMLIIIVCGFCCSRMTINFSPGILGAESETIANSAKRIRAIWKITAPSAIVIEGKSADDALRLARKYASRLREAGVRNVVSPSDLMFTRDETRKNVCRWKAWFEKNRVLERLAKESALYGFSVDAFKPFTDVLSLEPTDFGELARFLVNGRTAIVRFDGDEAGIILEESDKVFFFSPKKFEMDIAESFKEEKRLVIIAAAIMFILVWWLLKRPGRVFAVFIAPLFSVTLIFAIFSIFGVPFSLAALAVIPIVFGLSIDHGIMVTHSLECRKSMGVRRAIIMASITAFFSIGLLAISSHPVLKTMGLVIFSGLVGELFAALWLVPLAYPKTKD